MTTVTAIPMKSGNVSGSEGSGNATTRHGESVWINSNGVLPPVDCPLLIELSNVLVPATRTGFIAKKRMPWNTG